VSHRPLRALAVVVLAATAALVPVHPDPAGATPTVLVTDTSARNTDPRKAARVECPPLVPHVIDVDGWIDGGSGLVALTALLPDEDGNGATARGRDRVGSASAWSVTVRARCSARPAPQRVARTRSVDATNGAAEVTCPSGHVLSTGFDSSGEAVPTLVEPGLNVRTVTVTATPPPTGNATVTAIALCAADPTVARTGARAVTPGAAQLVVGFGGNATGYIATAGPCQNGAELTGSGGGIVGGSDAHLVESFIDHGAGTVTVFVADLMCCPYGTLVIAYGICS